MQRDSHHPLPTQLQKREHKQQLQNLLLSLNTKRNILASLILRTTIPPQVCPQSVITIFYPSAISLPLQTHQDGTTSSLLKLNSSNNHLVERTSITPSHKQHALRHAHFMYSSQDFWIVNHYLCSGHHTLSFIIFPT